MKNTNTQAKAQTRKERKQKTWTTYVIRVTLGGDENPDAYTHAVYFGCTGQPLYKRWHQHKTELVASRHRNQEMQTLWTYFGEDCFEVLELVGGLTKDEAATLEKISIETAKQGENPRCWLLNLYSHPNAGKYRQHVLKTIDEVLGASPIRAKKTETLDELFAALGNPH